jgi:plasmid stabilization system protein ParE
MAYRIEIMARAERDLDGLFEAIHASDSAAALKWYREFYEAILALKSLPNRCPVTHENPQLRHLLYGNKPHIYRVIYRVLDGEKRVNVLHIRHGARRKFTAADLE